MSTFKSAREDLKNLIAAAPALAGIPVFLEREGTGDIDAGVSDAMNTKGLAIIVMESDGAVKDRSSSAHVCVVNLVVPICILENAFVNRSGTVSTAIGLTGPEVIYAVMASISGKEAGDGEVSFVEEAWTRLTEEAGEIQHYLAATVPVYIKAS